MAVRSAGIALVGRTFSFVLSIISTMVLARLLTPRDFGIMTMVTTASLLFSSWGLNGFPELIMQREKLTASLASNLFWINLGVGVLLTAGFASMGPLLGTFYHNAAVVHATEGMSLTIVIGCLGWIHYGLLQRAMRFRAIAIIGFIATLIQAVSAIVLAKAGWGYWALVAGSVVYYVALDAGSWWACRWVPSWPARCEGTGSGFRFAINIYSHCAFSYLTHNTDNILVGRQFGARALGLYKKAYDLFVLAETQLMAPISAVAVNTLSRVSNNREQFIRYFLRAISVLALLGMGIGTDFALVGNDLMRLLLGPGWEQAGRIFALFGPGIGLMLLYDAHGWIHISIGRPDRWLRWALLEFVCTASLFLLALRWGPSGIAAAWTASYFLLVFPGFWYAGKPIDLKIWAILGTVWRFFVASIAAGCGTLLIFRVMPHFELRIQFLSVLIRIISVSLVFFVLYFCGIILLHKGLKPIKEAAGLLRDLKPGSGNPPVISISNERREAAVPACD